MSLVPAMVEDVASRPLVHGNQDPKIMFAQMQFTDLWEDAGMPDLVRWLRGNKALRIPSEWRPFLPDRLEVSAPSGD